ncbi:MAG: hypothetical protein V1816_20225 [Pseudomonadota bacterium]
MEKKALNREKGWGDPWIPGIPLLLIWALAIWTIDPRGEFMINDDWTFIQPFEALLGQGKIMATGWGGGGPALVVQLLWAGLFTSLFGFSITTLRVSVLVMGVMGSLGMLVLLRRVGASRWISFLGAAALTLNPLFLSQGFTFMTDVIHSSLAILSLLVLHVGVAKEKKMIIAGGLLLALASILSRQIGIVIPLGFMAACLLHPRGAKLGRAGMVLMSISLTFVPWIGYEVFLGLVGSTPVTKHQVFGNILGYMVKEGWPGYLYFIYTRLVHAALAYSAFFAAPVLALQAGEFLKTRPARVFVYLVAAVFVIAQAAAAAGLVHIPTLLYKNIVIDFGIGPLLFKDSYVLGIRRLPAMPTSLYLGVLLVTVLSLAAVLARAAGLARRVYKKEETDFTALTALAAAVFYLGIITLTGFHDRYLIPVIAFFIIWLTADWPGGFPARPGRWAWAVSLALVGSVGLFSILGTHDFMATRRAAAEAHHYLLDDLKVAPCDVDGGFEFNGYHCHREDFRPRPGLSWWWVGREDYLVTLGPLPGYRTVRTFPFHRLMGPDGAVFVLRPSG